MEDGLVLFPKAGGYSPDKMIEQQDLVNKVQAEKHQEAQLRSLTFPRAVERVRATMEGVMKDWIEGERSVNGLLVKDSRLQGIGLMLVVLGAAGLVIDTLA